MNANTKTLSTFTLAALIFIAIIPSLFSTNVFAGEYQCVMMQKYGTLAIRKSNSEGNTAASETELADELIELIADCARDLEDVSYDPRPVLVSWVEYRVLLDIYRRNLAGTLADAGKGAYREFFDKENDLIRDLSAGILKDAHIVRRLNNQKTKASSELVALVDKAKSEF